MIFRCPDGVIVIHGMTAYASAEAAGPTGTLICELRSVNHRYLEVGVRLPEELRALETPVRERIGSMLSRGKVDVTVRRLGAPGEALHVDDDVLGRMAELNSSLSGRFPALRVDLVGLLRFPGVLRQAEVDPQTQKSMLLKVLDQALAELSRARARDGEKLANVLREKLDGITRVLAVVRDGVPQVRTVLREKLETRLGELKQGADPGRLEQELVLQVARADVEEELDRLDAHVGEARRVLSLQEPVGRRLDFLMQEFNREANTLGSKSVDQRSTNAAIELKVLTEQMREQVQNIE